MKSAGAMSHPAPGNDYLVVHTELIRYSLRALTNRELVDEALAADKAAEAPARDERESLLQRVTKRGFIDDYAGTRVSARGRRFRIEQATVWNLTDSLGIYHGQAAAFSDWVALS